MPNIGTLGWAYVSGSTVAHTGQGDQKVTFYSGSTAISGSDNFTFDYANNSLILNGDMEMGGVSAALGGTVLHAIASLQTTSGQGNLGLYQTVAPTGQAPQAFIYSNATGITNPQLRITNAGADANGALIDLFKERYSAGPPPVNGSVVDDDVVGTIRFTARHGTGGADLTVASIIQCEMIDVSGRNASMVFQTEVGDTATEVARTNPESATTDTFMGGFGSRKPVGPDPQGQTLSATQSGAVFEISTNGGTVTLPATVKGVVYTFVWTGTAGQTYNISPNASDKIKGSLIDVATGNVVTAASSGAGADDKDLQLDSGSQIGDRVTIMGDGSDGWIILEGLGSWVFQS